MPMGTPRIQWITHVSVGNYIRYDAWLALIYHYEQLVGVGIIVRMSHIIN